MALLCTDRTALMEQQQHHGRGGSGSSIEWTTEEEILLIIALQHLKPVGINKFFNMIAICELMSQSLHREVSTTDIWNHLKTLYSLDMLDELEPLPFPNEGSEFCLPDDEFQELLKNRFERDSASSAETAASATDKAAGSSSTTSSSSAAKLASTISSKDVEKKLLATKPPLDMPKRTPKRTRGSMSLESNSPSTTPPPIQSNKRRRI